MKIRRVDGQRDTSRGQTTLDFAIGVSLFLAVLLFILLFIPGILSPFTASTQAETVSSNRVADQLSQGTLGNASAPYVLDSHCTVAFFRNASAPPGCSYRLGPVEEQVDVAADGQRVNVTLRGNVTSAGDGVDLLCWDTAGNHTGLNETTSGECGSGGVTLARGPSVPTNQPSITAVRVVSLDGTDVTLQVAMW